MPSDSTIEPSALQKILDEFVDNIKWLGGTVEVVGVVHDEVVMNFSWNPSSAPEEAT